MMTSVIISAIFKGIEIQAIGSRGKKYSCTCVDAAGKKWNVSFSTVTSANKYFAEISEVKKMVLYIYHPKKKIFEVCKYYER